MTELTADERALLGSIRAQPGVTVRGLAVTLKRRPAAIVALVRALTEKRCVERRPLVIQRSDGHPKTVDGLFEVVALDPSVCPSCGARRRHFEGGPECKATAELRELGKMLDWQRVPYGYGRAIQTSEQMWDQFLNSADYAALMAGIRHAREWIGLNSQIRRQFAATTG